MAHLSVRNFGPIQELELEIQDFMVLIGPSGSGKSTVAKLVYYFHQLPKEFSDGLAHISSLSPNDLADLNVLENVWSTHFLRLFNRTFFSASLISTNWIKDDSEIKFTYDTGVWLQLKSEQGKIIGHFSEHFQRLDLDNTVNVFSKKFIYINTLNFESFERSLFIDDVKNDVYGLEKSLFGNFSQQSPVFINAERILGPYLSQFQVQQLLRSYKMINVPNEPVWTQTREAVFGEFISKMAIRREVLCRKEMSEDFFNRFGSKNIGIESVRQFLLSSLEVMGAKWDYSGSEEWLVLPNGNRIPLRNASSGQQVSSGLLLELYNSMLEGRENGNLSRETETTTAFFIEEPEAHLFPIQQKAMMEAIVTTFNAQKGNQVLLTTHSPYTLTVLNNLIAAWKGAHLKETGELNPATADEIAKVIPQPTWLNPAQVGAYYVADGGITSIMTETGLIGENELDSASEVIMEDFDEIMDIRRQAGRGATV